jgi:hypothetical protein
MQAYTEGPTNRLVEIVQREMDVDMVRIQRLREDLNGLRPRMLLVRRSLVYVCNDVAGSRRRFVCRADGMQHAFPAGFRVEFPVETLLLFKL